MLKALPIAHVVHSTASRTRLRVPSRQGDAEFFAVCAGQLSNTGGVLTVRPRAITASLVIEHDGAFDAIASQARDAGLFIVAKREPEDEQEALSPAGPLAAAIFGGLALLQLFRNRILPPAITLLWYAASLARSAHEPSESAASVRSQGRSRSRRPT
jgi:hypothetical protein